MSSVVTARTPAEAQTLAEAVSGHCFDLALREFEPPFGQPSDSISYRPPPRILFFGQASRSRNPIVVPEGAVPSPHRVATWGLVRDTLRVTWSTGSVGLSAWLVPSGRGLAGVATPFANFGDAPPASHAELLAMHVECESYNPFPLSEMRRFLQDIRLETGVSLRLRTVLPTGLETQTTPTATMILDRGLGIASDATSIEVGPPGTDAIQSIVLRYPGETDVEALRDLLAAAHGPWNATDPPAAPREAWYWIGRAETISLVDGPETVVLTFRSTGRLP